MRLAIKPYVTTGIAIVGASVIAVAPIVPTPTEIQVPNPITQVERGVQLTANEIENTINQVIFAATSLGVRIATLPAPLAAQLLDTDTQTASLLLALGALGLGGPVISGPGAIGHAVQDVVNQLGSFDIEALINTLIGVPGTIIDGLVNGGFGPNVDSLALNTGLPFFAGGLISGLSLGVLPGTFPALQVLVDEILGALGLEGPSMVSNGNGAIEGAVNALVLNLVARPIVGVAGIVGAILAPILGEETAAGLPIAALGLFGPLISGPGALGTAIQDVADSLGSGNIANVLNALIGAPATLIGGVANGGYGPNLQPLLPDLPTEIPPGIPVTSVLAGGLIPNPNYLYPELLQGLGLTVGTGGAGLLLPAVIPTLQGLVSQVFGLLPAVPGVEALSAPAPEAQTLRISTFGAPDASNKKLVTLDVVPDSGDEGKVKGNSDNPPGGPVANLTAGAPAYGKVPPKVEEIKEALKTPPGPELGGAVSEAAKPEKGTGKPQTAPGKPITTTDAATVDTTDGNKVIPDSSTPGNPGNGKKKGGGSNPVGSAISSAAKNLAGAVRGALGG